MIALLFYYSLTYICFFQVLFGRGKPYQGHSGNIRLHKVVDLYKARYSQARRHEKTEIAEEIVQFIKSSTGDSKQQGRFLKKVDNEEAWVEVSDSVARDKVSHAPRGKPRKEAEGKGAMGVHETGGPIQDMLSTKPWSPPGVGGTTAQALSNHGGFLGEMSAPLNKRPKLHHFSEMERFAARNSTPACPPFLAASMIQHHQQQQQLLASALAERQLAAGLANPYGGMAFWGGPPSWSGSRAHLPFSGILPGGNSGVPPSAGAGVHMNPLLQQLAAERQMRGASAGGGIDPRLWR